MRKHRFFVLTLVCMFLLTPLSGFAISGPKSEEFLISQSDGIQYFPVIRGHEVLWAECTDGYPYFKIMYKDLNSKDAPVKLADSTDPTKYLVYWWPLNNGGLYMTEKYCFWTAQTYDNYHWAVIVYDLLQKKETRIYEDNAAIYSPAIYKDTLLYMKSFFDYSTWRFKTQIVTKNLNTKADPEPVYTFKGERAGPVASEGYAVWTDDGDVYLYDINKNKYLNITESIAEKTSSPVIQTGFVFYKKAVSDTKTSLFGYNIKDARHFKVYEPAGNFEQTPTFNPGSNNMIFTEQGIDENSHKRNALMLFDAKSETVKEIASSPTLLYSVRNQCSSNDLVVYFEYNTSSQKCDLNVYNHKSGEIVTICKSYWWQKLQATIDGKTIVWVDTRLGWGKMGLYGYTFK